MKRIGLLLSALVICMALPAQICEGLHIVTLRCGDAFTLGQRTKLRAPLSLSAEQCLLTDAFDIDGLAFGAGVTVGSARTDYGFDAVPTLDGGYAATELAGASCFVNDTRRHLTMGVQGYVHYDVLGQLLDAHNDQIDTYAVVTAGLHSQRLTRTVTSLRSQEDGVKSVVSHPNSVLMGLQVGCRYWALPNVGITLEAGYDGLSVLDIGVNACF